jgi:hypothetical protein
VTQDVEVRDNAEIGLAVDDLADVQAAGASRVTSARVRPLVRVLVGGGTVLGCLDAAGFRPNLTPRGFREAQIVRADPDEVDAWLAGSAAGAARLTIGTVSHGGPATRAMLHPSGFSRHTFLCGQSGSGKTFSLGVVLEQLLLETDLRIVVIDPNSDFTGLHTLRDWDAVNRTRGIPLTRAEYDEIAARYRTAAQRIRIARARRALAGATDELRLCFSDLDEAVQALVLRLDPLKDREEYRDLRHVTQEALGKKRYSLAEVHSLARSLYPRVGERISNLGIARWGIWCDEADHSLIDLLEDDWRLLVADVGSLASRDERSVLAGVLLYHLWQRRTERRPILVVIDEAHHICPAAPADDIQAQLTSLSALIAGEGRKYGIYLLVASQRPQKVHENVVSQCENLLLMRMNSIADLEHLAVTFSHVPRSILRQSTSFRLGEALVAGGIAPHPLLTRIGGRLSAEGGGDVPADWVRPAPG